MNPELFGAVLCFYGGWLMMLLGLLSLIRMAGIGPILLVAGYVLACFGAQWTLPNTPVNPGWQSWTVMAIHWSNNWSIVIGLVVMAIVGVFIWLAFTTNRDIHLWNSTTTGGAAQPDWGYVFVGLVALVVIFFLIRGFGGVSTPKTPLTELARTAQRFEKKFGTKMHVRENPFHLRVPAEFLNDDTQQKDLAKLAEEAFDQLKDGAPQKLTVKKVIGLRLKSSDLLRIDEVIVEFEGQVATVVGKKTITKMVDDGTGKMVEKKEEVDDVKMRDSKAGITIPFGMNQEQTKVMADGVKSFLDNKLLEAEHSPSTVPDEPAGGGSTPTGPRPTRLPRLVPLLDPIK